MTRLSALGLVILHSQFALPDVGWAKLPRPITVMVIDTGISKHDKLSKYVQYDGSKDYVDTHGHGTHVAGIVAFGNNKLNDPVCSQVKIYSCKYYDPSPNGNNLRNSIECIKKAHKMKIDYINYSGGGTDLSFEELNAYRDYSNSGGIVVTSAGNERASLESSYYFPASFAFGFTFDRFDTKTKKISKVYVRPLKNFYSVESQDLDGKRSASSNYHPLAFRAVGESVYSTLPGGYGSMTGTSQAAPQVLHTILKQRCKEINEKVGFQQASN